MVVKEKLIDNHRKMSDDSECKLIIKSMCVLGGRGLVQVKYHE